MPIQAQIKQCTHIKLNGYRCKSPALIGQPWCYFHARTRRRAKAHLDAALPAILLLEDAESIQGALMQVIDMLMLDQIELRKARLILRAIEIAQQNVKNVRFERELLLGESETLDRFQREMIVKAAPEKQSEDDDDAEPEDNADGADAGGDSGEEEYDRDVSWLPQPIWCEPALPPKKPPQSAETEAEAVANSSG